MATPTAAANAYSSLARMLDAAGNTGKSVPAGADVGGASFTALLQDAMGTVAGAGGNSDAQTAAAGPSFNVLLKDAMSSVMDAGHKSDAQTVAMARGKANVMDVVTAVAETDVAVSTLVSVRDRVIQAYDDIMKMPI